jgi:glutathione peroxidase
MGVALAAPGWADCPDFLQRDMRMLRSEQSRNLCEAYGGKALLIVNTASYCGFTPQFTGLEALYQSYRERGLQVIGFPSDDFKQEDDEESKTAEVCYANYGVTFDMYAPIAVRGSDADPLYRALAAQAGSAPKWNFYKYVVDREGEVVGVFSSRVKPDDPKLREAIEKALGS